jgi:hypothetical protein
MGGFLSCILALDALQACKFPSFFLFVVCLENTEAPRLGGINTYHGGGQAGTVCHCM